MDIEEHGLAVSWHRAAWVRRAAGLAGVFMLVFSFSGVAGAEPDFEIDIPIDTVVRGDAGSVVLLTDPPVEVPSELVGRECVVVAQSENQSSVHPDNHLLVETGNSTVLIEDVESEPGVTVNASGSVVLGENISVSLIMGPDGVFSAGIFVRVDCAPGSTTTTPTSTTTIEISPTTVEQGPTTTSEEGVGETTTTEDLAGTEATTTTSDDGDLSGEETTTSVEDEVLSNEVLPFTGPVSDNIGQIALVLVALGTLLIAAMRPEH
jgi:hypothetical protein